MKISKFIIFFLFVAVVRAEDWSIIRNDSVRVFYAAENKSLAENILTQTNQDLKELTEISGLGFSGEVRIFLAKNEVTYNNLTRNRLPDWSEAVTQPRLGIVYLQAKPGRGKSLNTVLRHELVHVLIGKNFDQPVIPRWFEEGTALLFSGENFSEHASVLSRANLTNSLLSLQEIEEVLKFKRNKANLAYAQSFLGVKMIVDALGWDGIKNLLKEAGSRQNWPAAFSAVLKLNTDQFEWRLQNMIREKYRWNFLLQSELFIWIVLPILAVVVFLSIRIRNLRTYRRWEAEDVLENYRYDDQESNQEQF